MKKFITITLLSLFTFAQSQTNAKPPKGFKITYNRSSNGKLIENQAVLIDLGNGKHHIITKYDIIGSIK